MRGDRPTCAGDVLTELDLDSGAAARSESCDPVARVRGWLAPLAPRKAGLGVLDLDRSIMGWRLERRT